MDRQNRPVLIYVALLLVAGVLYLCTTPTEGYLNTLCFTLNFLIYVCLLVSWMYSLRQRLLPSRSRSYLLTAAWLMLLFLLTRTFKYRIHEEYLFLVRTVTELYYVPQLLIPTLFFMTCLRLARGETQEGYGPELWLLVPGVGLALLVLTNDLHHLFYLPTVPLEKFSLHSGTYAYGPVFWLAMGWIVLSLTLGCLLLFWLTGRRSARHLLWPGAVGAGWVGMTLINLLVMEPLKLAQLYHLPELHIFGMLGIFESCIRARLIPSNENHTGFFARLELPALVTDRSLQPVWTTAVPVPADRDLLKAALEGPVELPADTRLFGMELPAGLAFWTVDESGLRRADRALQEANGLLGMENEIIRRQRELAEERAGIDSRRLLFDRTARAVYPAQKRISDLLEQARPDTPSFRRDMARILVLTAYVKRKANFVMLGAERDTVTAGELCAALQESAHYLSYCGLHTTISLAREENLPRAAAMAAYDSFALATETLLDLTGELWVRLSGRTLLLLADLDRVPPLPALPLPCTAACEDGQLRLQIDLGGDGV